MLDIVSLLCRVLAWIPFHGALCSRLLLRVRRARSDLLDGASASNRLTAPLFLDAGRAVATEAVSTVARPGAYGQCGGRTRPRFKRSAKALAVMLQEKRLWWSVKIRSTGPRGYRVIWLCLRVNPMPSIDAKGGEVQTLPCSCD